MSRVKLDFKVKWKIKWDASQFVSVVLCCVCLNTQIFRLYCKLALCQTYVKNFDFRSVFWILTSKHKHLKGSAVYLLGCFKTRSFWSGNLFNSTNLTYLTYVKSIHVCFTRVCSRQSAPPWSLFGVATIHTPWSLWHASINAKKKNRSEWTFELLFKKRYLNEFNDTRSKPIIQNVARINLPMRSPQMILKRRATAHCSRRFTHIGKTRTNLVISTLPVSCGQFLMLPVPGFGSLRLTSTEQSQSFQTSCDFYFQFANAKRLPRLFWHSL